MSIEQNHPAVSALHMDFDVDNVSPVPHPVSSEVLPDLMAPQPVHSLSSHSHSLPDPPPAFSNFIDPNGQPMHVPSANLTAAAFLDPTPLDPFPTQPPANLTPYFSQSFSGSHAVENGMTAKLPTSGHASSLPPPMNPIPSASAYVGIAASSLQSALEPLPSYPGQHRAVPAPTALPSPPVASSVNLTLPVPSSAISPATAEALASENALTIGRDILDQVVQSASTAANLCRTDGSQAGTIVGICADLRSKLAYVSDVITERFKEKEATDSPMYNNSNDLDDYPTPLPPLLEATDTFPVNQPSLVPAISSSSIPQIVDSSDRNRKRCGTDSDAERRVKLKVEPQDDPPVSSSYPSAVMYALQSPPPSRPASPPPTLPFVFNQVKQALYPPITGSMQPDDLTMSSSPKFPPLRTAWSDTAVPTRHSHSMSTGSISVPSTTRFTTENPYQGIIRQPVVPGRMNRSGSVGGSYVHPFTFSYNNKPGASPHQTWQSPSSAHPSSTSSRPSPEAEHSGHEEDGWDDDEDEDSGNHSQSPSSSDVPQEYRSEVDRIFFEYLNKICSNLDATDSKGESIHQTLMAKKMQRLDESPDFRPFKFRIQAFTNAFLELLASKGYPEEKIPMKKIRNYLWRNSYIQRYNEDGKKSKSKGNHIWNIEAKKTGDGKWEFRPFHRKLAGLFPGAAYCGLPWVCKPRVWDPQASWQNIPVYYSSPSLPPWLSWKNDELFGTPTPDAQSCDITVVAKFMLDGQESHLSHTFHLNVSPRSAMDPVWPNRNSSTVMVDLPRRASEPQLNRLVASSGVHTHPTLEVAERTPSRIVEVLQNVAARVATETDVALVTQSPMGNLNHLAKQKHAVEQGLTAYHRALNGFSAPETRRLAEAAQEVVAEAAQYAVADRAALANVNPSDSLAISVASIGEMTDLTQEALAVAVTMEGSGSDDLDVIQTTSKLLKFNIRSPPHVPAYSSVSTFVQ
ncbi:hypothetical protein BDP27DRAFT_1315582 [Rhodocollybia butyracea]|uniref:Uncharacterized protein n=1 Tax=Rhodocollybia butyracea TaxID=206335 RepID=A0A9P5Q6T0_9AGAR|nr:hypothetical protein BDP27DRAFT_1315582 [Rhodocollybia butyracea]